MPTISNKPNAAVIPNDGIADAEVTVVGGSLTTTIEPGTVIGVTDNGGSLTVDDGGTTLSIDDGGSTITVDGTVNANILNSPVYTSGIITNTVDALITNQPIQVFSTTSQVITVTGVVSTIYQERDLDGNYNPTHITYGDTGQTDAFQRLRVSQNNVLLSAEHLYDELPITFAAASGVNGYRSYDKNQAAVKMYTTASAGSYFYRQTRRRFHYTAGNSQLIACTFSNFHNETGIRKRVGYFDENNGLFLESDGTRYALVRRTKSTGSPEDHVAAQSDWNIDKLDGNGPSGIVIDFSKAQIMLIDFQWLGVGRVRAGFDINGLFYPVHQFVHANLISTIYMSTPTLPIRYEIYNTGGIGTGQFDQICAAVLREGGTDIPHYTRTINTFNTLSAGTTTQNALSLRVDAINYVGTTIVPVSFTLNNRGNATIRAMLIWNATFASPLTWVTDGSSYKQSLQSSVTQANYTDNTGVVMDTIFVPATTQNKYALTTNLNNSLITCGVDINGTADTISVVTTSLTGTQAFDAALSVGLIF